MFDKIIQFINSITDYQKYSETNTFAFSIPGRKKDIHGQPKQEDSFYISDKINKQQLIIVADGLGGQAHGEFASQLCVQTFKDAFESLSKSVDDIPLFLRQQAMDTAVNVLQKSQSDPEYLDCATTLCGFMIQNDSYFTINIGDSRAYKYNNDRRLIQITKDHTPLQNLLDKGDITIEEAANHPLRHQMSSAIGMPLDKMEVSITGPETLTSGEILLAFTDGIHDYLKDQEIQDILKVNHQIEILVKSLVQAALDNGSTDNITACAYKHIESKHE